MEWHDAETTQSQFRLPGGNGVYEIPLGALTSADTPNLFAAGRTADGDQYAGASLRVMGTAFATGQACGVTAAQHAQKQQTAIAEVQSALRTQGALIDGDDLPEPVELVTA
jgi:FAD dependent oxidoreductase